MIPEISQNGKNKSSQCKMIIDHLRKYGSITPRSAEDRYGIMRLGARIHDLRKAGFDIVTTKEITKNRFGVDTVYARYFLRGERDGQ